MKRLLIIGAAVLVALVVLKARAQSLTKLGTLTVSNALGWNVVTNATGYKVYVSGTNVFEVGTNRWPGDASRQLGGVRAVYVTATNGFGESEPSVTNLVTFRAGVPLAPVNMQIYTVVLAAATNALAPPPPALPASF